MKLSVAVVVYFFNLLFLISVCIIDTKAGFFILAFDSIVKVLGAVLQMVLLGFSLHDEIVKGDKPGVIINNIALSLVEISLLLITPALGLLFSRSSRKDGPTELDYDAINSSSGGVWGN